MIGVGWNCKLERLCSGNYTGRVVSRVLDHYAVHGISYGLR
jgi:hypothetical protein